MKHELKDLGGIRMLKAIILNMNSVLTQQDFNLLLSFVSKKKQEDIKKKIFKMPVIVC